jgi:hypothetical protein
MRHLTVIFGLCATLVVSVLSVSAAQPRGRLLEGYGYHYIPDDRGYMIGRDYAPFYGNLGPEERALTRGVSRLEFLDGGPHTTCTCFVVKIIRHCDVLDDQGVVSGVAYPQGHPEKAQPLIMGRRRLGWWEGMFYPRSGGEWEMALRVKRCNTPDEIVYYQITPAPPPSPNWRCYWQIHDCPGH